MQEKMLSSRPIFAANRQIALLGRFFRSAVAGCSGSDSDVQPPGQPDRKRSLLPQTLSRTLRVRDNGAADKHPRLARREAPRNHADQADFGRKSPRLFRRPDDKVFERHSGFSVRLRGDSSQLSSHRHTASTCPHLPSKKSNIALLSLILYTYSDQS